MKKTILALLLCSFVSACGGGGGGDEEPPLPPSPAINLSSSDGVVTLSLEEASFTAGVTKDQIVITKQSPSEVEGATVLLAYDFKPDGIEFTKAVALKISLEGVDLTGISTNNLKIAFIEDGKATPLDTKIDEASKTVSAQITHFSIYGVIAASGGGGDSANALKAKQIASAATYASAFATLAATQEVLRTSITNYHYPYTPVPHSSYGNFYNHFYSTASGNSDDDGSIAGSLDYTLSGNFTTGYTFTVLEETPITHEHVVNSATVPAFNINETNYSGITYKTTDEDHKITGSSYGSMTFTLSGGEPIFSSIEMYETDVDADSLTVILEDGTEGTIDLENWTSSSAVSDSDNKVLTTVENMSGTVTYQPETGGSETYECTGISGTVNASYRGRAATFTIGTGLNCTCTNCD